MANQTNSRYLGSIMTSLTFIVTIIALIPAFLSLNKDQPLVYWSYEQSDCNAPDGIDKALFSDFLMKNGIPAHELSLKIKNCGNAPAKEVKFTVSSHNQIVRYTFSPPASEKPIWVDVPPNKELGLNSGVTSTVQKIENLTPNRLFVFKIGTDEQSKKRPKIDVIADGIESKFISDISMAHPWNPYRVFYLPGYIFAGGIIFTLFVISLQVILSNPLYKSAFSEIGKSFFRIFAYVIIDFPIFRLIRLILKATKN